MRKWRQPGDNKSQLVLNEEYGVLTPEEWSTTIGLEDLTNPVDTPEDDSVSDPDGERDR